jgi:hypothetical protein
LTSAKKTPSATNLKKFFLIKLKKKKTKIYQFTLRFLEAWEILTTGAGAAAAASDILTKKAIYII